MEKGWSRLVHNILARRRFLYCAGVVFLITFSLSWTNNESIVSRVWPAYSSSRKAYDRPGYEAPLANGIPLRIMGLGASTVFGAESNGLVGWRPSLRNRLVLAGNPVNMVGSQRVGDMLDNDVEAYPGARVDAVYDYCHAVMSQMKPNLAIVYAGSNDNFQNASLPSIYKRYYALVNYVLTASPRAAVIMGTLMPTTETQLWGGEDRVGGINQQLRTLYQVFKKEGKPVVLIEMGDLQGVQVENLGPDHMHPTPAGYEIMSRKFFEGILEADARGFLKAPEVVVGIADDGEAERAGANGINHEAEKQKKKEESRIEQEAVQQMIDELKKAPWDGTPAVPPDKPVLPIPERPQGTP